MSFPRVLPAVSALGLLALLAPAAWGDVWIVDQFSGPGADFTDLQSGVDAAADGDVVLVREPAASYTSVTIDGKGITLVAEVPGIFIAQLYFTAVPGITVRNIGPDQQVVVRGFRPILGLAITDCAGSVWIDDVETEGLLSFNAQPFPGAHVERSGAVTFTGCALRGTHGFTPAGVEPAPGFQAESSTAQLFGCSVSGGKGGDGDVGAGQDGAPGLETSGSALTLSGCTVLGGDGAEGWGDPCTSRAGNGGPGLVFQAPPSNIAQLGTSFAGGVLDLVDECGILGPPGPAILGVGTLTHLPGVPHDLSVNSPVTAGETLVFELLGVPGELAAVLLSSEHTPLTFGAPAGVLLPGLSSLVVLGAGVVDGAGSTTFAAPAPAGGHLVAYAQGAFVDASPASWLGGGSTVIITP